MPSVNVFSRHPCFSLALFIGLFLAVSVSVEAEQAIAVTRLQISFPGLKSVHTEIRRTDGIPDSATGELLKKSNWKNDQTTVSIPQGTFDLVIRKGHGQLVIDNVNCHSSSCFVDNIAAKLTVKFPTIKSVHTAVYIDDNTNKTVDTKKVTQLNWQNNQAVIPVLRQQYKLLIRKGKDSILVPHVDCRSGSCQVDDISAQMIVKFPGLSAIHTSVYTTDNQNNKITGNKVAHQNWKKNQAVLTVFRKKYDVAIQRINSTPLIRDNVDCTTGQCQIDNLVAHLKVKFPGMKGVHTSIQLADSTNNKEFAHKNWQNDQAVIPVLRQQYKLVIRKGKDSIIVPHVDCQTGTCQVEDLTAKMTVNFPGLTAMHTSVYTTDNLANQTTGNKITKQNWKSNQAVFTIFRKKYDVAIQRKHATPLIRDKVDCTSGHCQIDNLVAHMLVKFPGMSSVHTSVQQIDNTNKIEFSHKNWQKNQAALTVLRQEYKVLVRRNHSQPIRINHVDCRSGRCIVDKLTATLTVKFPQMKGVHTSVYVADGHPGTTSGPKAFKLNWQKNQAKLTVFRQNYDISVLKNKGTPFVIDNIDCQSGSCVVDNITANMTVNFPGIKGVHTSVHIPDNLPDTASGGEVTHLNWQSNQAELVVFKQRYDVKIRRSHSEPIIIDQLDCRSGHCKIDQITSTLTVNFPGLRSVHTSVHIPDKNQTTASGKEVTHINWQNNKAVIKVFRQHYDLKIKQGPVTKIINNLDCTQNNCSVNDLTTILSIQFPGLINVHSSVHIPDEVQQVAAGSRVARSNWKTHQTTMTLLRSTYDVKVRHAVDSVFDKVNCNQAHCQVIITGNLQSTLINGDLNKPIANKYVSAYEKMADGSLQRVMKGKTSKQGKINFTLAGLKSNRIYVLKTYNPFKKGKVYYSSFISHPGKQDFIITKDGENSLDLSPPTIAFATPQNDSSVPNLGFKVMGTANDNRKIDRIELTINDPVKGINTIPASYQAANKSWSATVPDSMLSLDNSVLLTATAFDQAQSKKSSAITVNVIEDNQGPQILISSHTDNDEVPVTGFLLSGTVTDLTQVTSLKATLLDALNGQTLSDKDIDFSSTNGIWTLAVNNGSMTLNNSGTGAVDITLNAIDSVGNSAIKNIHLKVIDVNYSNAQMINRITFGATPALISEINNLGALQFLEQQLNPESIDDSELDAMQVNLPTNKEQLQAWTLRRMISSKRQLLEVMTWFWDNHFNTDINTKRSNAQGTETLDTVQYELNENQAFRANALGNFGRLLKISAKSPAMLIYLDSISNVAGDSNENYAREVQELHTLGVNGGYSDQDVEIGAEIFTGWHIKKGQFFFDASQHSTGSYTLFEGTPQQTTIAEGGISQGEVLLNALATHPSTANFICNKLITLFVSDTPPVSLISRCAQEFLAKSAADDQIKQVLRLIMQSAEFNAENNYRNKIKTPVEFVVGTIRHLQVKSSASDLIAPIRAMGLRLYENPVPTGWPEIGIPWINTSLLIERIKWINTFMRNAGDDTGQHINNPIRLYRNNGYETADGIVGFLLQLTLGDDYTDLARNIALDILGSNFDLSNPDAESKLIQLHGAVLSFPQYQYQ